MLGIAGVGLTVTKTLSAFPSQPKAFVSAKKKSLIPIGKVLKAKVSPVASRLESPGSLYQLTVPPEPEPTRGNKVSPSQ